MTFGSIHFNVCFGSMKASDTIPNLSTLQLTANGSMEHVTVVRSPVVTGITSVNQSLRNNHSTGEENALILFAMDIHNYWSAPILNLALVKNTFDTYANPRHSNDKGILVIAKTDVLPVPLTKFLGHLYPVCKFCSVLHVFAVDCEWEYRDCSSCSRSCGSATKTCTPFVTRAAANGGEECPVIEPVEVECTELPECRKKVNRPHITKYLNKLFCYRVRHDKHLRLLINNPSPV